MDDDTEMFKIVVIGNSGTGKSNIAFKFIKGEFKQTSKTTIGVEFMHKMLTINNTKVKVVFWDTAGQQQYKALSRVYYKGAIGVILVYDVTSQKSYLDIQDWYRLAKQNLNQKDVVMILVGNKIDLNNQKTVPYQRAIQDYKSNFGIQCFQVSARTGQGIQQSIMYLVQQIFAKYVLKQPSQLFPPQLNNTKHLSTYQTNFRASVRPQLVIKQIKQNPQKSQRLQSSSILVRDNSGNQKTILKKDKKCQC